LHLCSASQWSHCRGRKTLELLGWLGRAAHYPLAGRELSDPLRGLLAKHRSLVLLMEDELSERERLRREAVGGERGLDKRLSEVQSQLAASLVACSEAVEDRSRIFEVAELLRAKYATLLRDKEEQTLRLDGLQAEKLECEQAVLAAKLEMAQQSEQHEQAVFALSSELLRLQEALKDCQQQLAEGQLQLQTARDDQAVKEGQLEKALAENGQLSRRLEEQAGLLGAERDRVVELGAELLTLVNRRDVQQAEHSALQQQFQDKLGELREEQLKTQEVHTQLCEQKDRADRVQQQLVESQRANAEMDLELRRSKLAAEEAAMQLLHQNQGQNLTQQHKAVRNVRSSDVGSDPQQAIAIQRLEADLQQERQDRLGLEEELSQTRGRYREALSAQMKMPVSPPPAVVPQEQQEQQEQDEQQVWGMSSESVSAAAAQRALVHSFAECERSNRLQLDKALAQRSQLKQAYRSLLDSHRSLLQLTQQAKPQLRDEELMQFHQDLLVDADSYLQCVDAEDRVAIRDRLKRAESLSLQEAERMGLVLSTYQRNLQVAETRAARSQQEALGLRLQLQQLLSQHPGLAALPANTADTHDTSSNTKELEALVAEIRELRSQLDNRNPNPSLEGRPGGVPEEEIPLPDTQQIRRGEPDSDKVAAMRAQLQQAQLRASDWESKHAAASAELRSYQEYMKEAVAKYKRQIQQLRAQLLPPAKHPNPSDPNPNPGLSLPAIHRPGLS